MAAELHFLGSHIGYTWGSTHQQEASLIRTYCRLQSKELGPKNSLDQMSSKLTGPMYEGTHFRTHELIVTYVEKLSQSEPHSIIFQLAQYKIAYYPK